MRRLRQLPDTRTEALHPECMAWLTAVRAGDGDAARTAYAKLDADADPGTAVLLAGELSTAESVAHACLDADPADAVGRTLLGSRLIVRAWQARGGAVAAHTPQDRLDTFRELIDLAETELATATGDHPDDAAAWTLRVITCRALRFGTAEARRRHGLAVARRPHLLSAHRELLQQLAPKWGGSLDEMHAFAAEAAYAAPAGHSAAGLVALAYLEHVGHTGDVNVVRTDAAVGVLTEAAERLLSADTRTSGWVWAHSAFAAAFGLALQGRLARPHLDVLEDRLDLDAWWLFDHPEHKFKLLRRAAYRA
ncbi:hypothetical protein [Hamadaea tsunoensis]|uniref:hypothetical protein n=1 Tax=Hamadaea tsunoensis TaxID=53368 RepID=UPI0012F84390|nr:hypothetical protein [Hamadaea tsunoensis]